MGICRSKKKETNDIKPCYGSSRTSHGMKVDAKALEMAPESLVKTLLKVLSEFPHGVVLDIEQFLLGDFYCMVGVWKHYSFIFDVKQTDTLVIFPDRTYMNQKGEGTFDISQGTVEMYNVNDNDSQNHVDCNLVRYKFVPDTKQFHMTAPHSDLNLMRNVVTSQREIVSIPNSNSMEAYVNSLGNADFGRVECHSPSPSLCNFEFMDIESDVEMESSVLLHRPTKWTNSVVEVDSSETTSGHLNTKKSVYFSDEILYDMAYEKIKYVQWSNKENISLNKEQILRGDCPTILRIPSLRLTTSNVPNLHAVAIE